MGIISPPDRSREKTYSGSRRALSETMRLAANEFVESPVDGTRMTRWQAVCDRQFQIAMFAECDKDATSAAKFIRDTLFGRPAVMKQDRASEIPAVVFAGQADDLQKIAEKAARAEQDSEDDGCGVAGVGVRFDDGTEEIV